MNICDRRRRRILLVTFVAVWAVVERNSEIRAQDQFEIIDAGKRATALVLNDRSSTSGSAFCVSTSGHFVTNSHVVERTDQCRLILNSGESNQKLLSAVVVHRDPKVDLAILKAVGADDDFHPLSIRSGRELRETERVFAFGYPYGKALAGRTLDYPSITVIVGRVSALRRSAGVLESIQLDAQLNPGNSGGPVIDASGAVGGVVRSGAVGTGIMSAIPAETIQTFLNAPVIAVVEPTVESMSQPVTMTATVENPLDSDAAYDVALIVRHSDFGQRTIPMVKAEGKLFTAEFHPIPPAATMTSVPVRAVFATGEVHGLLPNVQIGLGDRMAWLAEISKIDAVDGGHSVSVDDEEPIVVPTLTAFPTQVDMGPTVVTTDLTQATSIRLGHDVWTELKYQVVASIEGENVADYSGTLPLDSTSLDVLARSDIADVLSIGELRPLADGLPDFLSIDGALERANGGVRLSEHHPIVTRNRHMLDMDFTFEALVTFQAEDRIAYLGLGPGAPDRSYNGLTDSVYLRLHAPRHGGGMMDIQNWRHGHSPMNAKIDWVGLHRVRITKTGDMVRFLVDPDNDGPTDDDIELVIPGIREFSPFLNGRNCRLFMSGMGTVTAVRLGFHPSSTKTASVNRDRTFLLGESLPPFLHTTARYRTTKNRGIRITAGGPIQTEARDFLLRDFELETDILFEKSDHVAYLGIGRGQYGRGDRIPDSVHLRVPAPHLASEPKVQNGEGEATSLGKPLTDNGRCRLRMIKKGDVLEFLIDVGADGSVDRQVTIPHLSEYAPYLNGKTSYLFFGGEVEFLSLNLRER